jgi:hypothetical protein
VAERPPRVHALVTVEGDRVVVRVPGWRCLLALRRRLALPLDALVSVAHDPRAREHVAVSNWQTRRHRSGLWRYGTYHCFQGWSFWAIGMGRNAVVLTLTRGRYRYVVVEVADPAATVRAVEAALGARRQGRTGGS